MQEAICGCAGIFSAPIALQLYAQLFEEAGKLDKLEAFSSFNGADFYGLARNTEKVQLVREPWQIPSLYPYESTSVVPLLAGQTLKWKMA